jgi:hypothetical protein
VNRSQIIVDALALPVSAIEHGLMRLIRKSAPEWHVFAVTFSYYDLMALEGGGVLTMKPASGFVGDITLAAGPDGVTALPSLGWWELEWQGKKFEFMALQYEAYRERASLALLLAPTDDAAHRLVMAVREAGG